MKRIASIALIGLLACSITGCTGQAPNKGTATNNDVAAKSQEHDHAGHDHSGWWCTEHGVPESKCGLCDTKLAAALQKKGDWCKEHDRPDSQCFTCHPELESVFAAEYEAKYGKKPPKPTE